jgi:hypothetical protein
MIEHKVGQGECMASIAHNYGLRCQTVWEHSSNQKLRELRKNPNILFEGDIVNIPDKFDKQENGATEQRHRFRRKGVPSKVRIRLLAYDKPRANLEYAFEVNGLVKKGATDNDGVLRISVPPEAKSGKLTLHDGDLIEEHIIELGMLDPITEIRGVQQRLFNLAIPCPINGTFDEHTKMAILQFQGKYNLQTTGNLDNATRSEILKRHGC